MLLEFAIAGLFMVLVMVVGGTLGRSIAHKEAKDSGCCPVCKAPTNADGAAESWVHRQRDDGDLEEGSHAG